MKTYFNFLSRVRRWTPRLAGILIASLFFTAANNSWSAAVEAKPATQAKPAAHHPNILLIVLDDVGIDQMSSFGYGGATAPRMPNVDAIANAGVRFRNFWTMPECSPSRALMFEGRFPLRTNVYDAILSVDLANSQVSPYETTTPKLLKQAGYINGLFGKFHLTGSNSDTTAQQNNPLNWTAPYQLGWDYFAGWQDGGPHPIDTTAGGVAGSTASYACGFIPNLTDDPNNGTNQGACYFADNTCSEITASAQAPTPGRTCMERGGILVANNACQSSPPPNVDFTLENGYYAGQLVINQPNGTSIGGSIIYPPNDPSGAGRGYRSIIESDRAIDWINEQNPSKPWMATVAYSSAHTPYQQPATSLLPAASVPSGGFNCLTSAADQRVLSNQMIEAMDAEIGRVLVQTGLATRNADGTLNYDPARSDTMIVIIGDNGTYAPGVKAPFNPTRAKATVYQTGVWTPLIVAGPLVKEPGRDVESMVNIADLFQLFGEMAGIDVEKAVPKSRQIDAVAMLPYLTNPQQKSLRKTNFTQTQSNLKKAGYVVPPCVVTTLDVVNTCVQLFATQDVCMSEGGIWWGAPDGTVDNPPPLPGPVQTNCCGVNAYQASIGNPLYGVLPDWQMAMRDDDYKLVRKQTTDYSTTSNSCVSTQYTEFYQINQDTGLNLKLDNPERNLYPDQLDKDAKKEFDKLSMELDKLLDSQVACPGDGNLDGVVDQKDIEQLTYWAKVTKGYSSWYDFNLDGRTNLHDLRRYVIDGKFPRKCPQ